MEDSETRTTLEVVRRFNEAFNRHDVDGVMALMTDTCVFGKHLSGHLTVSDTRDKPPSAHSGSASLPRRPRPSSRRRRLLRSVTGPLFGGSSAGMTAVDTSAALT